MRPAVIAGIAAAAAVAVIIAVLYFFPVFSANVTPAPIIREGGLKGYNQTVVAISDVRLLADIADTPEKKRVGLGVRERMGEGEAMLFPFDNAGRHSFWMDGMKFPIDIIWLDSDKKVVHIEHDLEPCQSRLDCPQYQPDSESLYVLETVAGFSQRHGVNEGTKAEFELDPKT